MNIKKLLFYALVLGLMGETSASYIKTLFPGAKVEKIQEEINAINKSISNSEQQSNDRRAKIEKLRTKLAQQLLILKHSQNPSDLNAYNTNKTELDLLEKQLAELDATLSQSNREYTSLKAKLKTAERERIANMRFASYPITAGLGAAAAFALRRRKENIFKTQRPRG